MDGWEYRTVWVSRARVQEINGEYAVPDADVPWVYRHPVAAADYFNQLGQEGWELFAVTPGEESKSYTAIFKRPRGAPGGEKVIQDGRGFM